MQCRFLGENALYPHSGPDGAKTGVSWIANMLNTTERWRALNHAALLGNREIYSHTRSYCTEERSFVSQVSLEYSLSVVTS